MTTGSDTGAATEARTGSEELDLFRGDPFDRALSALGLPATTGAQALVRGLGILCVSAVPLFIACWLEGHLLWRDPEGELVARMSVLLDVPTFTQIVFFTPFATCAEVFMIGRMRASIPHIGRLTGTGELDTLVRWANRVGRSRWVLLVLPVAFLLPWLWARLEIANGLNSWHSVMVGTGEPAWFTSFLERGEWFTVAGFWVAFVSLPIYTFLWLRWIWKIGAWTLFLARISRLKLKLTAVHPDRTGGLGAISDVQTSFWLILVGTGVLFTAFVIFKLRIEEGNRPETLWVPVIVYSLLAPTVFLAPLFMFTAKLRAVKDAARIRLQPLAIEVAESFQKQWLSQTEAGVEDRLRSTPASNIADVDAAYRAVQELRVVPFDRRSATQLFSAAALPFVVLVGLSEIPAKIRALLTLLG